MSNPAVITLASVKTKVGHFQVEDNIGESIHLHLGEIRCDITIDELEELAQAAELALERFIKAKNFSIEEFSSEFLLTLAEQELLPRLLSVEDDKVKLSELQVDTHNAFGPDKFKPLTESRVLKALNGDTKENDNREERNYYGQSSQQRVESMLESIKINGYPANGQMIMLVKGSNRIYDGQHRAACMYYLWGDKEVPVKRLVFEGFNERKSFSVRDYITHWKQAAKMAVIRLIGFKTRIQNRYSIIKDAHYHNKDRKKFKDLK